MIQGRVLFDRAAVLGSLAAMAAIGALIASYGPAVAGFQNRFGITEGQVGAGLAVQSLGAIIGVLASPRLMRRLGNRRAMMLSLGLVGIGALLIAVAPSWSLTLAAAAITGLGLGGVDLMVSQLLILGTGSRGPALVNLGHGFFGVGTVAAPALIAVIGSERYPLLFGLIGLVAVLALLGMAGLVARPTPADGRAAAGAGRKARLWPGVAVMVGFIVVFSTHFGVQAGIGNWEPSYLGHLGVSTAPAMWATSGFWLMMVLGRFLAAGLTQVLPVGTIVLVSSLGMTLSLAWSLHDASAIWAFALCGLFIGPIFPNGLTWFTRTGYAGGNRFSYVMAAAMVGMAVAPWALGMAIDAAGLHVVPVILLAISVLTLLSSAALILIHRGHEPAPVASVAPTPE